MAGLGPDEEAVKDVDVELCTTCVCAVPSLCSVRARVRVWLPCRANFRGERVTTNVVQEEEEITL